MFRLRFLFPLLLIVTVVFGLASYQTYQNFKPVANSGQVLGEVSSSSKSSVQSSSASSEIKIPPTSLNFKTMFFGDVFWGRYIDDWSKASPLKYSYPFSGLNTLEREKYDAWIADMECPITTTYRNSATQDSDLKFSCPVEYTPEAAKWFDAFTLANNHTDNMEEVDGLDQTRQNLQKNGIQYFGHFDNAVKSDICEVVSFPVKYDYKNQTWTKVSVKDSAKTSDTFYIPLAMCGFHNVFKLPTDDELAVISQYSKYFPTVVTPHQGKEYSVIADELQQTYARSYIDLGDDAVIGDHVHTVQNTEVYKQKLIVYSLGNFIFDQQSNAMVTRGTGVGLEFDFVNDANFEKFLKFSQSCQKFKDDCLEEAKTQNLQKPTFTIKYSAVGTDNSGKLAKKTTPEVEAQILRQINWEASLKVLGR